LAILTFKEKEVDGKTLFAGRFFSRCPVWYELIAKKRVVTSRGNLAKNVMPLGPGKSIDTFPTGGKGFKASQRNRRA